MLIYYTVTMTMTLLVSGGVCDRDDMLIYYTVTMTMILLVSGGV